ncbi:ATP-binding cassette domain-containing protein [Leadbettera azotonutricia]|uniref:ABC transporter, ATP-binding protein n=1 Tax=Leadbettera azotonutricia (strain ATCC BAA-888 / DSM 13862 / ZAS-9) TaxID=545695 RepID=F5YEN8_LEAAZ|nr:ATP-binding cassette domain-containing protein [Leadbettera azotonutricia]AEF80607.1 ABC transporter, ATP-binding protein [Leadbettera azotonutricia ZAS-9]
MLSITVYGGHDKEGRPENLNLTLHPGDILCIVGPTGAGKSRFLEDLSCLAQKDTPTGRQILVDQKVPDTEMRYSLETRMTAQLSQNMNFVMDLSVREFILMHGECRAGSDNNPEVLVDRIVASANTLTGEALSADTPLTQLSGGQSRSLMIADTALLSPSPVVLIDELENAGVDRQKSLDLLVAEDKIVILSTHDPVLALLGEKRLCIRNGAVQAVIETSAAERANAVLLSELNGKFLTLREKLREGKTLDFDMNEYLYYKGK